MANVKVAPDAVVPVVAFRDAFGRDRIVRDCFIPTSHPVFSNSAAEALGGLPIRRPTLEAETLLRTASE